MRLSFLFLCVILALIQSYASQQLQMPEASAMSDMSDVVEQLDRLKHNVSELWENYNALKTALTETLNHLRVHQVELEETVHMLEHKHDSGSGDHHHGSYTDDHHHHSGEHGDSHGSHSHGDDSHSHGDDGQHHHSGEQHSHGDDHYHGDSHSHSEEHHHSHSGEHQHESSSHSHSHSHAGTGQESDSHHHHNGDSHEKSDDLQQVQSQGSGHSVIEPMVMPTTAQQHYHHHQQPHMGMSNTLQLINDKSFNRHHHHHHKSHGKTERNRTVVIPKYSEVGEYDFAICNVQPNRGIPQDQQQDINGRINLWQKKTGGPLNIHVRLTGFDMGGDHAHHGAHQALQQEETNETPVTIGHKHGFHVHSSGDLSNGCQSTGPHYNPKNVNHGGPNSLVRHIGDLGNIECDDHGNANIVFNDEIASLKGQYSIIGKSLVIHSGQDDYGLGGDEESLRTGNAGTRLACCVIEKVEKLPIRSYKFIKTATQYLN